MAARGRAAVLVEPFMARVRQLLARAGLLHVDETPARADGALTYVHVACNQSYTAMHTGGRSAADIDAGGVLPDFAGVIVRDGYAGYTHLVTAAHAWCGAHLSRDLKSVYDTELERVSAELAVLQRLVFGCSSERARPDAVPGDEDGGEGAQDAGRDRGGGGGRRGPGGRAGRRGCLHLPRVEGGVGF